MKFRAFAAVLLLSGCLPVGLYYKPGERLAKADDDLLDCKVMAENRVPPRMITRVIPGPVPPPRRVCNPQGQCQMVRHMLTGRRLPPEIVTEDANEDLRKAVVARCMGRQGYDYVRIPHCPAEITDTVALKATTVMPPRLSENACAIRLKGGRVQIVTPD